MPKKHTPSYTTAKPSYVHPSLQSSRASTSSSPSSEPQTVNQRINRLRLEQAPRATPQQRDELTSVLSTRTVPPELRRILHIPEVNAPKPQANTRMRRTAGGARPPPGPAVPTSWLQTSRHAPSGMKKRKGGTERNTVIFGTLARATDEERKRIPHPRSLMHQCLRAFALHWRELAEYEQHYIPSLPISLKESLISYLTLYGDGGCLDFKSLRILFQNEDGGTADWDEVQFLDLSGLLNENLTLHDLGKCIKRPSAVPTVDFEALRVSNDVADSWEEEVDDGTQAPPVPALKLPVPHFLNLSRLSLANPGQWASWPELLRISPYLNKITHLSLANWPRPSMTPNANTTSMVSKHTSVSLGGSHFYSDLDDDWHEATNIMRRLSKDTYSLQWLDLEGCNWLKALTSHPGRSLVDAGLTTEEWSTQNGIPGPDWNGAWQRITYVNVFQGWIPSDSQSLQNMPAGIVPVQLLRWLRDNKDKEDVKWRLNPHDTGHAVAEWVNREKVARLVAMDIQATRKRAEGPWCRIDFGWGSASGEKIV
ncbi:lysophosphatidylcholine acyltransferase [Stemphylium lycopersici]|uniref:Lysophosphatidylcholine acyltransferase n=1 Tax=Stemphylium lycopersici TaxID=183478 RepID=A0A364NBM1_STELY|nr:lysophosphatidylcholine acyltransferase [Stemphylium lycopersici]RAR14642.1 lysophosphatidylcholine acyltransferase [Stemphylium lycopersici]